MSAHHVGVIRILMVMAILGGCVDSERDPRVARCEAAAARTCEIIGYGGNETCYLAFAQHCSPEDADAARAACLEANDSPPETACVLQWR